MLTCGQGSLVLQTLSFRIYLCVLVELALLRMLCFCHRLVMLNLDSGFYKFLVSLASYYDFVHYLMMANVINFNIQSKKNVLTSLLWSSSLRPSVLGVP